MKLSEFIAELQEQQEKYGDLEVVREPYEYDEAWWLEDVNVTFTHPICFKEKVVSYEPERLLVSHYTHKEPTHIQISIL